MVSDGSVVPTGAEDLDDADAGDGDGDGAFDGDGTFDGTRGVYRFATVAAAVGAVGAGAADGAGPSDGMGVSGEVGVSGVRPPGSPPPARRRDRVDSTVPRSGVASWSRSSAASRTACFLVEPRPTSRTTPSVLAASSTALASSSRGAVLSTTTSYSSLTSESSSAIRGDPSRSPESSSTVPAGSTHSPAVPPGRTACSRDAVPESTEVRPVRVSSPKRWEILGWRRSASTRSTVARASGAPTPG